MEGTSNNEKRNLSSAHTPADFGTLVLFNSNAHFAYIYKKTERLVTAVYMITNFIKDSEPLKWKIRENALSLMGLNIAFNTVSLSERKDLIKKYQALSLEIVSLSGIAKHSGLISEMNCDILSREFSGLVATIEKDENKKSNEETVQLHPGFFDVAKSEQVVQKDTTYQAPEITVAQAPVTYGNKGQTPAYAPISPREQAAPVKKEYLPVKDTEHKVAQAPDSKNDRQAIILKLLAKKSGLSINDFGDSIKGVSAKTIQRELLAMVASGTIKKEGERRWSTYSLAQ